MRAIAEILGISETENAREARRIVEEIERTCDEIEAKVRQLDQCRYCFELRPERFVEE